MELCQGANFAPIQLKLASKVQLLGSIGELRSVAENYYAAPWPWILDMEPIEVYTPDKSDWWRWPLSMLEEVAQDASPSRATCCDTKTCAVSTVFVLSRETHIMFSGELPKGELGADPQLGA